MTKTITPPAAHDPGSDPALWAEGKTAAEIHDEIIARRQAKRRAGILELDKTDTILEWLWAERTRTEAANPAEAAGRLTDRESAALEARMGTWMGLREVTVARLREVAAVRAELAEAWSPQIKRSIMGKVTERPKRPAAEREALAGRLVAAEQAAEDAREQEHIAQRLYNRLNRAVSGVASSRRAGVQRELDIRAFLDGKAERGQEVNESERRESWARAGGQADTTIRIGADGAEVIP